MKLLILTALGSLACASLLSNCASHAAGANPPSAYLNGYNKPTPEKVGFWDGDGVQGAAKITIDLDQQKAFFHKGSQLVGTTPISSGIEGRKTPRGRFRVTEKDVDHSSSLYGVIKDDATGQIVVGDAKTGRNYPKAGQTFVHAPMLHFLRFNGAIGMHKGHLPGYAASHGCVRLPAHMAQKFYENAKVGTPVIVR